MSRSISSTTISTELDSRHTSFAAYHLNSNFLGFLRGQDVKGTEVPDIFAVTPRSHKFVIDKSTAWRSIAFRTATSWTCPWRLTLR